MATLINVCGTSRSGSTVLDLMLGNADDAFSCGEIVALFRPWRVHHFKIDCPCGQDPCPVWTELKDVPEAAFHTTAAQKLGVRFVVDSSKDLCWVVDSQVWAARQGMRVVNLVIWKHPLQLAYSHWKRGHKPDTWRKEFLRYHRRLFQVGIPLWTVSHEMLVDAPQSVLAALCARIGMDYFPGKERFWEKEHHHLFGSNGTRRQVEMGAPRTAGKRGFPPAFERELPYLREQLAADTEVQEVVRTLQERDAVSPQEEVGDIKISEPIQPRHPLWYYLLRLRVRVQRHFPQRYIPSEAGPAM